MELETITKIKKFRKKFLGQTVVNTKSEDSNKTKVMWNWQYLLDGQKDVIYRPPTDVFKLSDNELIKHFSQVPLKINGGWRGSLACVGLFDEGIAKWVCLDCDTQDSVNKARNKIIPVLKKYEIEHIWEFSGTAEKEKGHLWWMCDSVDIELLTRFVDQIFSVAGVNYKGLESGFEVYPTIKRANVIRLPGGIHLRTKLVNPILYKDVVSSSPDFILDSFNAAIPLTTERINSLLESPKEKTKTIPKRDKVFYTPRNLPLPLGLPSVVKQVASSCQAIQQVIKRCEDGLINDTTGAGHWAGLWLNSLALFHDSKTRTSEGETWVKSFVDKNRVRDWSEHQWNFYKEDILKDPERYVPSCQKWEQVFDMCEGCPLKGKIRNPHQIHNAIPIESAFKNKEIRPVRLLGADEIRENTFKKVQDRIAECLANNEESDILLASPQSSGKSYRMSEIIVSLAKEGKSILLSVPTGYLAMEHKKRIEFNPDGSPTGVEAFIVMSHKNLFDKLYPGFDCPEYDHIDQLYKLGLSSAVWKNAYCKKCPFFNRCPYPNQYKDIKTTTKKVIIIQHAHFTCRETLFKIMDRTYDVMFVDEAFIDSCHKTVKPKPMELEILESFKLEIPWTQIILKWLTTGGFPKDLGDKTKLNPTEPEYEMIKFKMDEMVCAWNVPDYVRYYNLNMEFEKGIGFHIFYPLPFIKLRVFTDATPPLDYLKIVLNNPDIEVYGEDEVLDYRKVNPENRVFQCLDSSMSKSSLKGPKNEDGTYDYDRFIQIIEFIADKAKSEYKGKKILVTTYNDKEGDRFKTFAKEFLAVSYPDLEVGFKPPAQICLSHMMIGTNEFADYEVQFLLAGVYMNGAQIKQEVYKLRNITNYWNKLSSKPEIPNPYPHGIDWNAEIFRSATQVKKIVPTNSGASVVAYSAIKCWEPTNPDYAIIERFAIAKTQQAIRLRFNDSRRRVVYILGNYFFPSFLITDVVLEQELLSSI